MTIADGLAFLTRTAKPAEEASGTSHGLPNLSNGRTPVTRKSPLRRSRPAEKNTAPYLIAVVGNPSADFEAAVAELVARVAPQRESGLQGILVLPRGTAEWRFAKAISAAGRQGVITHVSPLVDLQAGARRILGQLNQLACLVHTPLPTAKVRPAAGGQRLNRR